MSLPVFGSNPAGARLERVKRSPTYRNGRFQNQEKTSVMRQDASYHGMLSDFLHKPKSNIPPLPLPTVKTDLQTLGDDGLTLVWFGHSSYLIKSEGVVILVDPVFGNAAPVPFFGKPFAGTEVYDAGDMPDIDYLILSHDHYDHLDYETIPLLIPKVKTFITALGVGAHLERWGVPADKIIECDWWDHQQLASRIELTATPARHFSGRGLTRGKTLWASFVLNLHGHNLYLGGDSGYGKHFKEVGERCGPFELAILECGQYGKDWPNIHMFPEEVVAAARDLRARALLPVHWAKFALALHPWNEPIERLRRNAAPAGVMVLTPKIGEPITPGKSNPTSVWWNF